MFRQLYTVVIKTKLCPTGCWSERKWINQQTCWSQTCKRETIWI